MSTLTISSGVYVNDDYTPTTRFSAVTLSSVGVPTREKLYPQAVRGLADAEQPITFDLNRYARKKIIDDLLGKSAKFVARGPRRTLGGTIDAVVNDGAELCKFEWQEIDRRSGAVYTQSTYGYFRIVEANVIQMRESLQLVVYPVDRLRFVQSSTFLSVEPVFSPLSLSPVMWFDAADTTTIVETPGGGRCATWQDKSGNGYDVAYPGTEIFAPPTGTRTINGLNVLDFDGFNDRLTRASTPTIAQPNMTFAVAQADTIGSLRFVYDGTVNRQALLLYGSPARWIVYAGGGIPTGTSGVATPAIFEALYDSTSTLKVNGVQSMSANVGSASLTGLKIGEDSASTAWFDGVIGELLFFNRILTTSEIASMNGYLSAKWGIVLP